MGYVKEEHASMDIWDHTTETRFIITYTGRKLEDLGVAVFCFLSSAWILIVCLFWKPASYYLL
jgi:hypothetical protein